MILVAAAPVVTFSESYRFERLVRETETFGGFESETREAGRGSWRFEIVAPLSPPPVNETPFRLTLGRFSYDGKFGDDPAFATGAAGARFLVLSPESGGVRQTMASLDLKWKNGTVTVRGASKGALAPTLVAESLRDSATGELSGIAVGELTIGTSTWPLKVPFTGRLDRKTAGAGGVSGSATTLSVRGKTGPAG